MYERREHPRYPCQLRTGVLFPDGHTELLWARDISRRGLSIHADKPERVGTQVRILVFMFNARMGRQAQAEATARVASCVLDQVRTDFRIGLDIVEFIGNAEGLFQAEIERLCAHLQVEGDNASFSSSSSHSEPANEGFPLHRRIKLALAGGSTLTGWTEEVRPDSMRIALSSKLEQESVHDLSIPIVLAGEPEILSVQAKARVRSVVFRPMGAFATNFSVFDYQNQGLSLLRKELRQRFPEIAQQTLSLPDSHAESADEEDDTEALPSLAALRKR